MRSSESSLHLQWDERRLISRDGEINRLRNDRYRKGTENTLDLAIRIQLDRQREWNKHSNFSVAGTRLILVRPFVLSHTSFTLQISQKVLSDTERPYRSHATERKPEIAPTIARERINLSLAKINRLHADRSHVSHTVWLSGFRWFYCVARKVRWHQPAVCQRLLFPT